MKKEKKAYVGHYIDFIRLEDGEDYLRTDFILIDNYEKVLGRRFKSYYCGFLYYTLKDADKIVSYLKSIGAKPVDTCVYYHE